MPEHDEMRLSDVCAPVFVGRPPSDAYIGLARLDTGEIRHYNYGEHPDPREPCYIFSRDSGFTWERRMLAEGVIGADQKSPVSGEFIRLRRARSPDATMVVRSRGGIDGAWTEKLALSESFVMLKPPVFVRGGRRILVGAHGAGRACMLYSDDDGDTWKVSAPLTVPDHRPGGVHKGARWNHGAAEPTVVELRDGRIWMLLRTSLDYLYESYSHDGGETWEPTRPSRFYATTTMPTIGRLSDGRILLVWNNCTPLPAPARTEEVRLVLGTLRASQDYELAFTSRDAIHAAISDDDGRTWHGFREICLDALRNARDFAETGGTDRSVHQSQFVELGEGKVLVACGQHERHRQMLIFDTRWLCEKSRGEDFSHGLKDWCIHMYIAGIRGHCAFNRKEGASLVDVPDAPAGKALLIRRPVDRSLITENEGAVWNFPAGTAGALDLRVMLRPGCGGARISLIDRWFNPTDLVAHPFAMFNLEIAGDGRVNGKPRVEPGRWHDLRLEWHGLARPGDDTCSWSVDGVCQEDALPLNRPSVNGISYVHLINTAVAEDAQGFLVGGVKSAGGH